MQFIFIDSIGIETELFALRKGTQPYNILACQHEGQLTYNDYSIRNSESVDTKILAFLDKARKTNADLVLTPEYSCPFQVIKTTIENTSDWPRNGKLWALGCESITREELAEFRQQYNSEDVLVHFDDSLFEENGNFFDPLVYLFKANHLNAHKLIVLLQFKSFHMGAWTSPFERNTLIQGKIIYIIRNATSSVSFLSLICSEAMNFPEEMTPENRNLLDWDDRSYLIFNPQLNPEPTHQRFSAFKNYVLNGERKELITLNWSNNSSIHGTAMFERKSSRSGVWIKSTEIDISNERFKKNHEKGMYYFHLKQNRHAYLLNSSAHAFLIANLPVHITAGLPEQRRRTGPWIMHTYIFNEDQNELVEQHDSISDRHLEYLNGIGCSCAFLTSSETCIIQKEMIVSLTTGNITGNKLGRSWRSLNNLFALQNEGFEEANKRITFTEDTYPGSINQRGRYINAIRELETAVFKDTSHFPKSISDLKDDQLIVGYGHDADLYDYKFNVMTEDGETKVATICFMGDDPDEEIGKAYSRLQGIFDSDNQHSRRIVIFYKRGEKIRSQSDNSAGKINSPTSIKNSSIFKP